MMMIGLFFVDRWVHNRGGDVRTASSSALGDGATARHAAAAAGRRLPPHVLRGHRQRLERSLGPTGSLPVSRFVWK